MNKNIQSKADLIVQTFNRFNGKNLDLLSQFYAEDAVFEDPIVRISGLKEIRRYYKHVYEQVKNIEFKFEAIIQGQDDNYTAPWTMNLAVRGLNGGNTYAVRGVSLFRFNAGGLVSHHRDFLDLGEMLYERLPVFGIAIRQIKSRLAGSAKNA